MPVDRKGLPKAGQEALETILRSPQAEAILTAAAAVLDGLERERGANSDDARAEAQEAALEAATVLQAATGLGGLMRRRAAAVVSGRAAHATVTEAEQTHAFRVSSMTDARVRTIMQRVLLDTRFIPTGLREAVVQFMKLATEGHDPKLGAAPGTVLAPLSSASIRSRDNATTDTLRTVIVGRLGYTSGAEGNRSTRRLPGALLGRAQRAWFTAMGHARREQVAPVTAATIRAWCAAEGELRNVFDFAYQQGMKDAKANAIDPGRLLPK